jgi:hypothetical protein
MRKALSEPGAPLAKQVPIPAWEKSDRRVSAQDDMQLRGPPTV